MKSFIRFLIIPFLCLILTACTGRQTGNPETNVPTAVTEIPCAGVEPRGLASGMQAYLSIEGLSSPVELKKEPESTGVSATIYHHARVNILEGPKCAPSSAWWLVELPDGKSGWLQVGSHLDSQGDTYSAALLPFLNDAVQRDVPEDKKLEAQVRYIVADIELGGVDVQKYYQDQVAAKPDDDEMRPVKIALNILAENRGKNVVGNTAAFERKPLRGGTSVVDAGTEYVQPGLDIVLIPCDRPDPSAACREMFK